MPLLYFLSDLSSIALEYLIRYRHSVIISNLRRVFPEKSYSELKTIKKQFYRHFSDLIFENIKSISQSPQRLAKSLQVKGEDLLSEIYEEGRSVLFLTGHFANWEYVKLGIFMYSPFINQAVYRPLKNRIFDRLLESTRNRYDGILIPQKDMGRKLLSQKKEQTLTIILYDQSPSNPAQCNWYSFLGQDTAFYTIVNKLQARTGDAVVFGHMRKLKRGHYQLRFERLSEEDPIGDYVKKLEEEIRDDPSLWLWSHRRWKAEKKVK